MAEDTFEKPVEAVLLVLAILAGGGFLGLRLYESQSLSQAKSDLQQGSWAAAEASAEKALALQQTGLLANPLDLIKARAEARYQAIGLVVVVGIWAIKK